MSRNTSNNNNAINLRDVNANNLAGSYNLDGKGQQQRPSTAGTNPFTSSENGTSLDMCVPSLSMANSLASSGIAQRYSRPTSRPISPRTDRAYRSMPLHCPDLVAEIASMFLEKETQTQYQVRADYLSSQPEVNEKMRSIVIDWLIDVVNKFKLHPESFYLAVNIMDRFLGLFRTTRAQLQLVGITSLLLAAKYEEMWAPDVQECIKITANTYTIDELLSMERQICAILGFRLTVPTPFVFLTRLLQIYNAPAVLTNPSSPPIDVTMNNAAMFFLEHAALDYGMLQYRPSLVASASLFCAILMISMHRAAVQAANAAGGLAATGGVLPPVPTPSATAIWSSDLAYYSRVSVADLRAPCDQLLRFARNLVSTKCQAVRRKYGARLSSISTRPIPEALPTDM